MVVVIAAKTRTRGKRPLWIQRVSLVICSGSTAILFPVATVRRRRMETRSSTTRATGIAWSLSILSTLTASITSMMKICTKDNACEVETTEKVILSTFARLYVFTVVTDLVSAAINCSILFPASKAQYDLCKPWSRGRTQSASGAR